MNSTQLQTTLAPIVSFLAGLLAAKVPFLDAGAWTQIIGGLLGLGGVIWGGIATKKAALVSQVASLPEVQSVKLEQSAPADLVNATPNNVTK